MKVKVCGVFEGIQRNESNFINSTPPYEKSILSNFSCCSGSRILNEDGSYIFFCIQGSPKCAFSRGKKLK